MTSTHRTRPYGPWASLSRHVTQERLLPRSWVTRRSSSPTWHASDWRSRGGARFVAAAVWSSFVHSDTRRRYL